MDHRLRATEYSARVYPDCLPHHQQRNSHSVPMPGVCLGCSPSVHCWALTGCHVHRLRQQNSGTPYLVANRHLLLKSGFRSEVSLHDHRGKWHSWQQVMPLSSSPHMRLILVVVCPVLWRLTGALGNSVTNGIDSSW